MAIFNAPVNAGELRAQVKHIKVLSVALDILMSRASYGDVSYSVYTAIYGIAYARQTGRLPGDVEFAIRAMSRTKRLNLVAEVANNCATMGDVPAYLIKKLGTKIA